MSLRNLTPLIKVSNAAPRNPSQLSGAQAWLNGTDSSGTSMTLSGSNVTTWIDQIAAANWSTGNAPVLTSNVDAGKSAVLFNGSNNRLNNSTALLNTGNAFTLMIHMKLVTLSAFPNIFSLASNDTKVIYGQFSASNATYQDFDFGSGNLWKLMVGGFGGISTGSMFNLCITYNGSGATTSANFAMYKNGVAGTITTPAAGTINGTTNALGTDQGGDWCNAYVKHFAVWNRVLSGAEISEELSYMQS